MKMLRWGILGAAKIARTKVIPAMQQSPYAVVAAISSRDIERAREAAQTLGIPKAYGSYEELLADPEIDAVYNPLPNHLHVPWSIKAAEAGKAVLCEKPIALTIADVNRLIETRDRTGQLIAEAFMVRTHGQWLRTRQLVAGGSIGEPRLVTGVFGYFNRDAANVRNQADIGGGALWDVGCYPVTMSRFCLGREPSRVFAAIERDETFGIDRLTSAILDFGSCHATFTCSTQICPFQSFQIIGTTGRIDVAYPFNTPPDTPSTIRIDDGTQPIAGQSSAVETLPPANQYTLQAEAFARAFAGDAETAVSLEDSLANTAVLEALFASAEAGHWVAVRQPTS